MGHRLGMPHASVLKRSEGSVGAVPVDPLCVAIGWAAQGAAECLRACVVPVIAKMLAQLAAVCLLCREAFLRPLRGLRMYLAGCRGPGLVEDSYSDRLDIMACCKGDWGLYAR